MLLINRLTEPGGIKRLELHSDTIKIQTNDGKNRLYRLESVVDANYEREVTSENRPAIRP